MLSETGLHLFGIETCLIFANLYSKVVLSVVDYIHCFLENLRMLKLSCGSIFVHFKFVSYILGLVSG
jgi:hypothetical protein